MVDAVRVHDLLRTHVGGRPENRVHLLRHGHPLRPLVLGDSKVEQLDEEFFPLRRQEDVLGFEVSVNDAERVGPAEGLAGLRDDVQDFIERQAVRALDVAEKVFSPQELHHDEWLAAGSGSVVEHAHDVHAVDFRDGMRFFPKPRQPLPVLRQLWIEQLYRYFNFELLVLRHPQASHASLSEGTHELQVGGYLCAGYRHPGSSFSSKGIVVAPSGLTIVSPARYPLQAR